MSSLDPEIVIFQKRTELYSLIIRKFKIEWRSTFEEYNLPSLGYKPVEDEFIIKVPLANNTKVQYIPFIYKELKTELIHDNRY